MQIFQAIELFGNTQRQAESKRLLELTQASLTKIEGNFKAGEQTHVEGIAEDANYRQCKQVQPNSS